MLAILKRAGASPALLILLAALASSARAAAPDYITAAMTDPARPLQDRAHDRDRKPAEVLAFSEVKPGARVADFMSGGAYFTRLLSGVVGDSGRVYAFLPEEELKNCAPQETAGTRAIEHDGHYANVTVLRSPVNRFRSPEPLDMIWTAQNFHDLYDPFMGPADVPAVTRSLYQALKPGGILLVIDHAAAADSGTRDTGTLHRIDPEIIVREALAAGFRLDARSDLLRNAADAHRLRVFDPSIRGRTDQVILRFRKPG